MHPHNCPKCGNSTFNVRSGNRQVTVRCTAYATAVVTITDNPLPDTWEELHVSMAAYRDTYAEITLGRIPS